MSLTNYIYIEDFSFNIFDFRLSENIIYIECTDLITLDTICDLYLRVIREFTYISNIEESVPFHDEILPTSMGELKLDFNSETNLFELCINGEIDIDIKFEKYSCVQFPFDENLLK